ncbi:MAG: squalene synthase HpnC [Planctomycetaceae bacterium]|jgi:squalene synthase HpnC|nr:squalene synthase HpnC [Planctomycetaceae bacterium]
MTEAESTAFCRQLARSHYENFHVAGLFLPKAMRIPFCIVYAYCRCADDIADEHTGSAESRQHALRQLDDWETRLHSCFDTDEPPSHPVFIALRSVARKFSLPQEPFADLLTAFRQDQTKNRYETTEELLGYCRYSANPVGRIILHLAGKPSAQQFEWSDSVCTALQLANFWQDVKRDQAAGRCYIPRNTAQKFGVDIEHLHDSPEFRRMMRELTEDARSRFEAGRPLVRAVPKMFRTAISLFLQGGLAVLDAIERRQFDVLTERPVLSKWTKLSLLLRTLIGTRS